MEQYAKVFDVFQIEKLFTYIFDVPISGVGAIVALRSDFQIIYQLEKCYIILWNHIVMTNRVYLIRIQVIKR